MSLTVCHSHCRVPLFVCWRVVVSLRVKWWEERCKAENRAIEGLVKAQKKQDRKHETPEEREKRVRRKELLKRTKDAKAALSEEVALRQAVEAETRELEALSKVIDDKFQSPAGKAKALASGSGVAAAMGK